MAIEATPTAIDRRTIITNFIRQIMNRIDSDYCTNAFNESTGQTILPDYIWFYTYNILSDDYYLYWFRIPWSDRKTIAASAQSFADGRIDDMLDVSPVRPTNLTYERPHFPLCDVSVDIFDDIYERKIHVFWLSRMLFTIV